MHENCYQVLGIGRSASPAEIRAAFVRQVKRHHPDAQSSDALGSGKPNLAASRPATLPHRLRDIQAAYRVLSDPAARAAHNRALEAAERHHFDRQQAVQRRLRRYDRRHPHLPPRVYRRVRWRSLATMALGLSIAARLALHFLG